MKRLVPIAVACALSPSLARSQILANAPGNVPAGPGNNSPTAQVDFADVDLDGDPDAACADGWTTGNAQSHLWINQGGQQGGTPGFFADDTAARLPAVLDQTRDVDFVDYDGDGDPDLYCVDVSNLTQQPSRFWTNAGGNQGGTAGFFVDETAARWLGLGGPGSSVWPGLVLGGGGFASWPEAHAFGDLDGDGDLDLIASAAGSGMGGLEPTRLFQNDGSGRFSEFNPSGFQLTSATIAAGQPGLWCEGVHTPNTANASGAQCDIAGPVIDVDVGDLDGDLDLDFLHMRHSGSTRAFRNLSESGALALRDVTSATFPAGTGTGTRYEQQVGDLDGDLDLDVYGTNWFNPSWFDATLQNAGQGVLGAPAQVPQTNVDVDAGELFDYDDDGRTDMFLGRYIAADFLARNVSAGGSIAFQKLTGGVLEGQVKECWDADVADVNGDGRGDVLKAHIGANQLLLAVGGLPDTHAPSVAPLEQPPDHDALGQPTRVRAHVVDNADELVTAGNATTLWYQVNSGPTIALPMRWMGGQVVHAVLPGSAQGLVKCFATSQDAAGNVGVSALVSFHTGGGCSGQASTYCKAQVNSAGCSPGITFQGAPSASAGSGFVLRTAGLIPSSVGLYFYSTSGPSSAPAGTLCVAPPILRTPGQFYGGAGACGGIMEFDFNAYVATGVDPALSSGAGVWVQAWSRDTAAPTGMSFSNGLHFTLCP